MMTNRCLNIVSAATFCCCVLLFILQSYREVNKYATGLTSTAMSTYINTEIRYPPMAVCATRPFRERKRSVDKVTFEANTLGIEDIFFYDNEHISPNETFELTPFVTFYVGRCFFIRVNASVRHTSWVMLGFKVPVRLYFLLAGQEICIITSECNFNFNSILPADDYSSIQLNVEKRTWPDR